MSKARWQAEDQRQNDGDPEIREIYEARVETRPSIVDWRFGSEVRRQHMLAKRFAKRHRLRSWRYARRNIHGST